MATSLMRDVEHAMRHPGATFEYEGWDVRWTGWRIDVTRVVETGFWIAMKDKEVAVSTVGGRVKRLDNEFEQIDISLTDTVHKSYPIWSLLTTKDKEDLAAAAAFNLMRFVKAGILPS